MKYTLLILSMAASAAAVFAQTPATPAAAKPAATQAPAARPAAAEPAPPKPTPAADVPAQLANIKCKTINSCVFIPPAGIPPAEGNVKTAFTMRYQEIKVGTGDVAEPGMQYIVHYTGWLASDGQQFDSSYNHRGKIMDKNRQPVKDANGKDKLGPPQPITFTQGTQGEERVLTALDQGFEGMRVGGIRRLIIPYQLAYGSRERPSPGPDFPVGIPPKSDLIMDVELLAVNEPPKKDHHMGPAPPAPRGARPNPGATAKPAAPPAAAKPAAPPATPPPAAPASATQTK
jgi:peptidylprolyl isomerase